MWPIHCIRSFVHCQCSQTCVTLDDEIVGSLESIQVFRFILVMVGFVCKHIFGHCGYAFRKSTMTINKNQTTQKNVV